MHIQVDLRENMAIKLGFFLLFIILKIVDHSF